jgi:DNA topoisomerase VI subunit B
MAKELNREAFTTSRLMEFFSEKELAMQIGVPRSRWAIALLKELIDNSLDACEGAGVAPEITITVQPDVLIVSDNGPGLPYEVLRKSLDYSIRVSDKNHYIAPTRGQLGNALKCVWAAPFVDTGNARSVVEVESNGKRHTITVTLDRIAQQPQLELVTEEAIVKIGTTITLHWPGVASYLNGSKSDHFYNAIIVPETLVRGYASLNPHAAFVLNEEHYPAANMQWKKWTPSDPTSPHWYDKERLRNLIAAYVNNGTAKTVREFVEDFRGLSSTGKQKKVCDEAGLLRSTLKDLVVGDDIDMVQVQVLLDAMCAESAPVNPKLMGQIGRDHLASMLVKQGGAAESIQYVCKTGNIAGMPYSVEVALAVAETDDARRGMTVGLNWTPALQNPITALDDMLDNTRVGYGDPVILVLHLVSPRFDFTDRGKSRLMLPEAIADDLANAIATVGKPWKAKKALADREGKVQRRELEELRKAQRRQEWTIKDACYEVMEEAYAKTSSNGLYPANSRQVMYAARPLVLRLCGEFYKNSASFTQGILQEYQLDYPKQTADWDVVYDDRGHLIEPHTQHQIGLGTLAVRRYVKTWTNGALPQVTAPYLASEINTSGPYNRYGAVLFVEKEGFNELLKASKIAERYDIAIQSTKGQTVTAARQLAEHYAKQGVRIFVLHDFDKSGFEIVANYQNDTRRYQYDTRPLITDIGLRLDDVLALALEVDGAEDVPYRSEVHPGVHLRACGATDEEIRFLVRRGYAKAWTGKRVELNALTSEQFIHFIERKLQENGVCKVVPSSDEYLAAAYRRAVILARAQEQIDKLFSTLANEAVDVPDDLRQLLTDRLQGSSESWDAALSDLAATQDGQQEV